MPQTPSNVSLGGEGGEQEGSPEPESARPSRPTLDPTSGRFLKGTVIAGKYRVEGLLGRGGVGEVFRAHHEVLDVGVAVKVLRAEAADAEASERFMHEARATARLEHPGIVRIFDFGRTAQGEPFIVMELLEGEDLASALSARGRLTPTKAVRTLIPIASALVLSHSKGIVHRDLKPENVFLARREGDKLEPKILDFGVAKLDHLSRGMRLTRDGELLGSPAYMAPEQARGDEVDSRGDVWSFCVVLYEMVTGRQLFVGRNYNAVIHAIVAHEPTPTTTLGVGDPELWEILLKGLARNPDDRWQSMRELGQALVDWLLSHGIREDIAGASIEAAFRDRDSSPPEREPSVRPLAPPPAEGRIGVSTLPPRARRERGGRIAVMAGAAVVVAGFLGSVWFLRGGPDDAPSAAPRPAPAVPPVRAAAPVEARPSAAAKAVPVSPKPLASAVPVAPLDALPVDGAEPTTPGKKVARAKRAALPVPSRSTTPPDLKDPFE